jgi:hypothetical protein
MPTPFLSLLVPSSSTRSHPELAVQVSGPAACRLTAVRDETLPLPPPFGVSAPQPVFLQLNPLL